MLVVFQRLQVAVGAFQPAIELLVGVRELGGGTRLFLDGFQVVVGLFDHLRRHVAAGVQHRAADLGDALLQIDDDLAGGGHRLQLLDRLQHLALAPLIVVQRATDLLVLLFVGGSEVQTLLAWFHAKQGFHDIALDGVKRHGKLPE